MQKRRTNRKKVNKGKKHGLRNIVLLIMAAIGLSVLIFYLSSPGKIPIEQKNKTITKHEKKIKKSAKHKQEKAKEKTSNENIKVAETVKPVDTSQQKQIDLIKAAIYKAAAKLDVSEAKIRSKEKPEGLFITVPLDGDLVDLTFANMIIKGDVMAAGGSFLSGKEDTKRNIQTLTFQNRLTNARYIIELYYDKNLVVTAKKKQIAVIVDDFGNYNGALLEGFAKTNPAVTFAILPDSRYGREALDKAKASGHECIIHIPMEPLDYPRSNPGKNAIYVQLDPKDIEKRMEDYIHQLPGCVGANNHMGSFASSDPLAMQAIMRVLKRNNLSFIDSRTTSESVAFNIAQKSLVPAFKRDLFIDEPSLTDENLRKQLSLLQALKSSQDYAVVIMHCHTQKHLEYLNRFLRSVPALGYEIVPISKLQTRRLPSIL